MWNQILLGIARTLAGIVVSRSYQKPERALDRLGLDYQRAFAETLQAKPAELPDKLMRLLVLRDAVSRELGKSEGPDSQNLERITRVDRELREASETICGRLEKRTLSAWRDSFQPPVSAWWWTLDEIADGKGDPENPLWLILAGLFLAISVSLATEISRRFLSGGVDEVSVLSTMMQALLALFAGSALTQSGSQFLERTFDRLRIKRRAHAAWKVGITFAVLVVILALRFSLPKIAESYFKQGVYFHEEKKEKEIAKALRSYQHAVQLAPGYAEAHYGLGSAYEDVLQYDKAISEYQVAIEANAKLHAAYNNLARLYILHRKDYASALKLINEGFSLRPENQHVQYTLYKNRGWANLSLQNYLQAEEDLRIARQKFPKRAAPHCLLAQVFEAREQKELALKSWAECSDLGYAPGQDDIEDSWLALAKERQLQPRKDV